MTAIEWSVIIPTRNRWERLALTLAALLRQCDVAMEVIVVDDGSITPAGADVVEDPRVRLVRLSRNRGVAAARNEGIRVARGKYIGFLDDDDLWAPQRLARLNAALATSGAGFGFTGAVVVDDGLGVIERQHARAGPDLLAMLLRRDVVPGGCSNVVVRSDLLRSVGGFDPSLSYSADWDLWIRLAGSSHATAIDEPLVAYRHHPDSWAARDPRGARADFARVVDKHRALAAELGVEADRRAHDRHVAIALYRARRSRRAAAYFLSGGLRNGDVGSAIRAPLVLVPPRWAARLRRPTSPRPAWLQALG